MIDLTYLTQYLDEVLGVVLILILTRIMVYLLQRFIDQVFEEKEDEVRKKLKRGFSLSLYFLSFLLILAHLNLTTWLYPLLTSAGIVGLIIGMSAQASLANIIAGIILFADKPFEVGDIVSIHASGVQHGKVLSIGFRSTRLKSNDGNILVIPNSTVSNSNITNYTSENSLVRVSVPFKIGVKNDLKKTREILLEVGKKYDVKGKAELLNLEVSEKTISFELKVWISDFEMKDVILTELNDEIVERFKGEGIVF
ncbi:MAG: mechanosensitive ion channel family protein [Candidatus Methanofastidiosia archaeon]